MTIEVVKMGGGYKKAVIGHTVNPSDGRWYPDTVFGKDEAELLERIMNRRKELKKNAAPPRFLKRGSYTAEGR